MSESARQRRRGLSVAVALLGVAVLVVAGAGVASAAQTWVRHAGNPLVADPGSVGPSVVVVGGTYYMFLTYRAVSPREVQLRTSTDGLTWGAPTTVLQHGGSGDWDEGAVEVDCVMWEGSVYKMWYSGINGARTLQGIGYATSPDGSTWTKYAGNPVLTPGASADWDAEFVRESTVVFNHGTYHMWYAATSSFPAFSIGYATSPDGLMWTKYAGNPVLTPTPGGFDDAMAYAPRVVHYGGTYHLWYSGGDGWQNDRYVIGYASSCDTDGVNWTKDPNNPVLDLGAPGSWECGDSADFCTVIRDGGAWRMYYSGAASACQGPDYQIGLATLQGALAPGGSCSADLAVTKSVDLPTVTVGQEVVFTVTVANTGADDADDILLSDVLPAGLTYVSDEGAGSYDPGTGVWSVASLSAGAPVQLHITATAAALGAQVNTVQISAAVPTDPNPANNQAQVTVTVATPAQADASSPDDAQEPVGPDASHPDSADAHLSIADASSGRDASESEPVGRDASHADPADAHLSVADASSGGDASESEPRRQLVFSVGCGCGAVLGLEDGGLWTVLCLSAWAGRRRRLRA
ncbi:MAG: DUF11 domain-containing protein [Deltaproteobacteria bacterium]|nr:DUF11 domain-containing protein [Deltaproteobacteria bacterium]